MAEHPLTPDRWSMPDRFTTADLGGGRAAVVDLERIEVHEVDATAVALLRRGHPGGPTTPEQAGFLRFAVEGGWIVPTGGSR
ncbi:hypothetical protein [Saccharothrix algeriensis]|uniref:Uncharacterized protein n=1 Tax=Saccharothrix algeriensis TaxID=173560 RepID=A0A8T8I1V4_9PSEU|nr:hypothetical protein [Saccharothrix algeriensis]MBM7810497.1 hypothetical protein [Saccharothrix algeriensis]QTR04621.1 hypothetical protein J7S33_07140 [Saccharothrix algeriensis]